MFQSLKKYQKLFILFCLISFVWIGFLGATHSAFVMQMGSDGKMMNPCPFMGQTAICNMSPLEHIGMWQMMFAALPAQTSTANSLLALALLSVVFFIYSYQSLFLLRNRPQFHKRRFSEDYLNISFLNNLQLALAKGRVHSKAY